MERALTWDLPKHAVALLPYYARVLASMAQVVPDVKAGGFPGVKGEGKGWLPRMGRKYNPGPLNWGLLCVQVPVGRHRFFLLHVFAKQ